MERVRTTIGFISRNTVGCGRTGIHFPFSTPQSIRIGTNTIYLMLSSGGLKDFRIKPGTAGAGFIIVEISLLSAIRFVGVDNGNCPVM